MIAPINPGYRKLLDNFHLMNALDKERVANLMAVYLNAIHKVRAEHLGTANWVARDSVDREFDKKLTTLVEEILCQQE